MRPKRRREIAALEPFHGEEGGAVGPAPVSDVAHDARMPDPREHLRLAQESIARGEVDVASRRDHLERHGGPIGMVDGAIDRTHATSGHEAIDLESIVDPITGVHVSPIADVEEPVGELAVERRISPTGS